MKSFFKQIVIKVLTIAARITLYRHNPTIIAVTGSVGKTATKDAIYAAIRPYRRIRKNEKSFNSEIGVPLTILGLPNGWNSMVRWLVICTHAYAIALFSRDYPELIVLEAGVDSPGDMDNLTKWLKPHMVVLTRLPDVPVHVEHFSSPEAVVQEKLLLVKALLENGVLVANFDDLQIQNAAKSVTQKVVGYARYTDTDYIIRKDRTAYYDDQPTGIVFSLHHKDHEYEVQVQQSIGMQLVYVYTAAIAVAAQFEVSETEAIEALKTHISPPGRMRLLKGIKDSVLIDDTYNSSPVAAESALQTLGELKYAKRKIAVLGDMLELGNYSIEQHRRIGSLVPGRADILITLGVRSYETAAAALEAGLSEKCIFQYDDVDRAGRELQNMLQPGDAVLVKGSQAVRAERVVEEVMQEPELASELLVRQDVEWSKR